MALRILADAADEAVRRLCADLGEDHRDSSVYVESVPSDECPSSQYGRAVARITFAPGLRGFRHVDVTAAFVARCSRPSLPIAIYNRIWHDWPEAYVPVMS